VRKPLAILITWNGFQDQELVYPYYRLLGAGFECKIIADSRDSKSRIFGILGVNMPCHLLIEDFTKNHEEFLSNGVLLVIPGGVKALEKLRQETNVIDFVKKWSNKGKVIASTCHGAQILISAGVTKGKKIAGYYSIKDDIENSGATYSAEPVVIDDNIVSSPHYDFMGEWMEAVLATVSNHNL
jgi:protease I